MQPSDGGMMTARLHSTWKPSGRYGSAWHVEFDGEMVVVDSRDPEHDAARALLARGVTGKLHLLDAETGALQSIVDIEAAAPWRMSEEADRGLRRKRHAESGPSGSQAAGTPPGRPNPPSMS